MGAGPRRGPRPCSPRASAARARRFPEGRVRQDRALIHRFAASGTAGAEAAAMLESAGLVEELKTRQAEFDLIIVFGAHTRLAASALAAAPGRTVLLPFLEELGPGGQEAGRGRIRVPGGLRFRKRGRGGRGSAPAPGGSPDARDRVRTPAPPAAGRFPPVSVSGPPSTGRTSSIRAPSSRDGGWRSCFAISPRSWVSTRTRS